jgi:sugar phosphate isomerase/epimerase
MTTRRNFLKNSALLTAGFYMPLDIRRADVGNVGIQLYTLRKEMLDDAVGTLKQLAKIGYKELESARSDKGNYYGLKPKEIKKIVSDLGMKLRSGHVHMDDKWQQTIEQAVETGQEYLIVSSMPYEGQNTDNYKKTADAFNRAGEQCRKAGLLFGYHNHDYEFEKDGDKILYDVLLESTDPSLVNMEMDLGWVIVTGNDPLRYFEKYPGRFPLWHLKDMIIAKKHSTEFGKGDMNIKEMLGSAGKSGMKYYFVEQEEYSSTPFESIKENIEYLKKS